MVASLLLHGLAALIFAIWAAAAAAAPAPPKRLLTARLVQLGTPRKPELLPTLAAPARAIKRPPPPTPPAPSKTPPAPLTAAAAEPKAAAAAALGSAAAPQTSTRSALDRLRREVMGAADGSAQGDTDVAAQGDRYAKEVTDCLRQHWVIEGMDAQGVLGRHALVLIRIGPDGRILAHRILTGSGQAAVDNAVSRAVRGCGRVSPPPAAWRDRLRRDGMEIDFTP